MNKIVIEKYVVQIDLFTRHKSVCKNEMIESLNK